MLITQRLRINVILSVMTALVMMLVLVLALYHVIKVFEASELADEIVTGAFERTALRDDYVLNNSERAKEQWVAKYDQMGGLLKVVSKTSRNAEVKRLIDERLHGHESIGKIFSTIIENREKNGWPVDSASLAQEVENRLLSQMSMRGYEEVSQGHLLQEINRGTLFSTLRFTGWGVIGVLAILIVTGALNAWSLGRIITARIRRLHGGVTVIGGGDLDYRVDMKGDDELVELSVAFNVMTAKLRDSYNNLESEVEERRCAEEALRIARDELEIRVVERTRELHEAHEMVKAERQRFYGVLETLPVYVALLTPDYHIPFANRFFRDRFGESGGRRCFEFLFNRTTPCEICETFTVLKTKAPHHWEWTGPDGRDYDIHDYPFVDADGAGLILEMGIDITDQRQAEKTLREMNETLEQRVTVRTAELQAVNFALRDSRRAALNLMEDALMARRQAEEANTVLRDEVFERRQAEKDLQQSLERFELLARIAAELLQAPEPRKIVEELCLKVMAHLGCHVFFNFLVDEEAGKLHLNACAGIPAAEAKRIEWLDFGVAVCGCVARAGSRIVAEHILSTPDERTDLVRSYGIKAYACHPLLGAGGKVIGTLSFGTSTQDTFREDDLSLMKAVADQVAVAMTRMKDEQALRASEEGLRETLKELQRSNEELEHFAYVASHDLQEPLRTVSSFVQLLSKRYHGRLDEKADQFIAFASEGASRMSLLLNDLLTYSRVGAKGKPLVPINMETVFSRATANLKLAMEESHATLSHDILPEITADDTQILLLLQNLIGNAIKFRKKEEPPRVHVSVAREADAWIFAVSDNGIGMQSKYFDRIFTMFQRLHAREQYPGTGIGLALCKKILERHHGRIWVESTPGQGSTFFFSMPVSPSGK